MIADWYIDRLQLQNFRQYEILDIPLSKDITLLIGENGAGKTAILDAIASLLATVLTEQKHGGKSIRHGDARRVSSNLDSIGRLATVETHYPVVVTGTGKLAGLQFDWHRKIQTQTNQPTWGNREVREFSAHFFDGKASSHGTNGSNIFPAIAYYGVERLVGERRAQGKIPMSRVGAYHSALDPRSDLKRVFTFLGDLDKQIVRAQAYGDPVPHAARGQFDAIDKACTSMLEPVGWHRLRWNDVIGDVTLHHNSHGTMPLALLATGPRIAAGLAIDLASRMARANPDLGGQELLNSTPGIVLIDEVDLHLHPSWQQQIVPLLRKTFPLVQFILTTHSPQVISTVEAQCIRVLDGSGVTTPKYARGLRSNVVMELLQGVSPVPPAESRVQLNRYLAMVSEGKGHSTEALDLREVLDREYGGSKLNQELLDTDIALSFAEWE